MELCAILEHLHAVGEAANAVRLERAAQAASGASRLPCCRLDRSELGVVRMDRPRPPRQVDERHRRTGTWGRGRHRRRDHDHRGIPRDLEESTKLPVADHRQCPRRRTGGRGEEIQL
jgi:hypothetical protein